MAKTVIFPLRTVRHGYTLAELLVVLAILGLVTAIAAPRFTTRSDPARIRQVSAEVVNLLRNAKISARRTGTSTKIFFNPLEKQVWIEGGGKKLDFDPELNLTVTGADVESEGDNIGIRFFPDGQSTGGVIEMELGTTIHKIDVIWANGEVRLAQE